MDCSNLYGAFLQYRIVCNSEESAGGSKGDGGGFKRRGGGA